MAADDVGTDFPDKLQRRDIVALLLPFHQAHGQLAHVGMGRPQIELRQRFDDRVALELGQFVLGHLAHESVGFHDVSHAPVVQRTPVAVDDDVLAV